MSRADLCAADLHILFSGHFSVSRWRIMSTRLPHPEIFRCLYTSSCHKKWVTPSSSSFHHQIQLPLQRPEWKPPKPMYKTSEKPRNCSIAEILRLWDALKIPVPSDLYLSLIDECTRTRDPLQAEELHRHMRTCSLRPSVSIYNRLLLMYVACGCMEYAQKLFARMSVRSMNSWSAIIAGFFKSGDYDKVVDVFVEMLYWNRGKVECGDLDNDAVCAIAVWVLKACTKTMNLDFGEQIHCRMIKMGYVQNPVLSRSLMRFYGKVGCAEGSGDSRRESVCSGDYNPPGNHDIESFRNF